MSDIDFSCPDLIVVGYGAAGSAAALTAAAAGARVVILEKQPADSHTCSVKMSGGFIFSVNDVERATKYLDQCAGGLIPLEVSRAWAEKASSLIEWHDALELNLNLTRFTRGEQPFDDADSIDVLGQGLLADGTPVARLLEGYDETQADDQYMWAAGASNKEMPVLRHGYEYFEALSAAVSRQPLIKVIWEAPARHLLRDDSGRVSGVAFGSEGKTLWSTHGVLLACGGFEFDEELKREFLPAYPMHFYGNPGNTGDGVRMAQEVGASLWHMTQISGRGVGHFELADGTNVNAAIIMMPGGYLITDKYGHRFADEYPQANIEHSFYYHLLTYDADARDYPRIPCFWFFDQRRISSGPLIAPGGGVHRVGLYEWSDDNQTEIERGWILQANTIEELAERVGIIDPQAAASTVKAYNEACNTGTDPMGRDPRTLIPLEPPFYCVALYPGGSNTCGGPRRNEHAEILDAFGEPIPGLYGAGELGQACGVLVPAGGANLSDANCFGRIAAERALGLSDDPVLKAVQQKV